MSDNSLKNCQLNSFSGEFKLIFERFDLAIEFGKDFIKVFDLCLFFESDCPFVVIINVTEGRFCGGRIESRVKEISIKMNARSGNSKIWVSLCLYCFFGGGASSQISRRIPRRRSWLSPGNSWNGGKLRKLWELVSDGCSLTRGWNLGLCGGYKFV
jgi:hypothetical protein